MLHLLTILNSLFVVVTALIMGDCDFKAFIPEVGGDIGLIRQSCDDETTLDCDSKCAQSIKRIYSHPCMQVNMQKNNLKVC